MRVFSGTLAVVLLAGLFAANAQKQTQTVQSAQPEKSALTEKAEKSATLDYACLTATGEKIPHPGSKQTYTVKDGEKSVSVPQNMIYVPAGEFTMGYQQSAHTVTLDAFCIGKYLVTNAEYKEFVDATGRRVPQRYWKDGAYPRGKENHPVLWVSWNDAQAYCAWVSKQTGWKVSLPTEAQWEKAARGPKNSYYPWGNERNLQNCNYNGVCAAKYGLTVGANGEVRGWHPGFTDTDTYKQIVATGGYTTPVGAYPQGKSGYGGYDMAGNAYEWCLDWYKADYWTIKDAGKNPPGPTEDEADVRVEPGFTGKCKVIRGGSWYGHYQSCCSVVRGEVRSPRNGYHSVGFRIVAAAPLMK